MSETQERYVNVIPTARIKKHFIPAMESDAVHCRLCPKGFASEVALGNHAKMEHFDAYASGDPAVWTLIEDPPVKNEIRDENLNRIKTEQVLTEMVPTSVMTLASKDVSYIIVKAEGSDTKKKVERIVQKELDKKGEKQIVERKVKKSGPIMGHLECLQPSTLVPDGTCHRIFFSCCEYSVHYRDEHTRRKKDLRCQVCEKLLACTGEEPPAPYSCEKLTESPSKQEINSIQVLQPSVDMMQTPKPCYQVKEECEDSTATTSDTVEDADRDEYFNFSDVEEQEMIDIIQHEPGEQTSAPVTKQPALTMQTNETSSKYKKCEKSEDLAEELKTDTEIALEDNILQTHHTRDYDVIKFNESNSMSDHNYVEKEKSRSISRIKLRKSSDSNYDFEKQICRNTCESPYQCYVCKKCFSQKCLLDKHIRIHTGEKPYQCNECKKCFNQKSNLDKHIRTHTGERPYQCNICKKCFNQKSQLDKHIRTHTGEKPFQCNVCKKWFNQKSNLDKHVRTHTGEKPYQCNICKKCFNQKNNLDKHIRTHTGEKPYQCIVCKKCFNQKSNLDKHIRTHR